MPSQANRRAVAYLTDMAITDKHIKLIELARQTNAISEDRRRRKVVGVCVNWREMSPMAAAAIFTCANLSELYRSLARPPATAALELLLPFQS